MSVAKPHVRFPLLATVTRRRLVAAGGAAALLAACGPLRQEAGVPAGTPREPVKLLVHTRGGGDGQWMERLLPEFERQYAPIKAEHVALGGEPDYWTKVWTMHLGKELGDVVWASTGNFHGLAFRGVFLHLDPVIQADKYDLSDYVKNGLETMKFEGKLYGMPWGGHPGNGGLLYNQDLLEKAGFKAPDDSWTFDRLMQAAQAVARLPRLESGEISGYNPGTAYLDLINVVRAYGGDFISKDGKKLIIKTEAGLRGLNWVRDAFIRNRVTPPPGTNTNQAFLDGRLAMIQSGYWAQFSPGESAIAGRFRWNVALQPKGPTGKRGTQLTINGQTIAAVTKHREAAWKLVRYLMDPEVQVQIVLNGGGRPALRKSVLHHPKLMSDMKAHKVFVPAIETAEPWHQPWNLRWPEFNELVREAFAPAWKGEMTVEQALDAGTPKFEALLAKPREGAM